MSQRRGANTASRPQPEPPATSTRVNRSFSEGSSSTPRQQRQHDADVPQHRAVSWLGSSALSQLEDSVRVIVRVRPLLPREIKEGCTLSPGADRIAPAPFCRQRIAFSCHRGLTNITASPLQLALHDRFCARCTHTRCIYLGTNAVTIEPTHAQILIGAAGRRATQAFTFDRVRPDSPRSISLAPITRSLQSLLAALALASLPTARSEGCAELLIDALGDSRIATE